jgi:type I restriction enzyme S subunit
MSNWEKHKLGEITMRIGDGLHGTPKYSSSGDYYFINGNNLINGKIQIKEDTKRVSEEEFLKYRKELSSNSVLLSINGTIGNLAFYNNEKCILGKSACYINFIENVNTKYAYYVMLNKEFQKFLKDIATGTTIPNVPLKGIRDFEVNLPPLPEQQAIAEILSSLDDKIELNLQINKTLEEMANALYNHWFVDFGPFKNGNFIESELGMIPEGWEVKKIRELADVINGFAFKGNDFIESGVPVLKIKNVKAGKILLNDLSYVSKEVVEKAIKARVDFKDILITMTGNRLEGTPDTWVGKCAMFLRKEEYYLNQRVSKIKIKDQSSISRYFISIMLATGEFQNYFITNATSSGGQANISPDLIYNTNIIVPPKKLMDVFDSQVSNWFDLIYNNEIESEILKQTRDYLLPKLISGEIRVKDAEKLAASVI